MIRSIFSLSHFLFLSSVLLFTGCNNDDNNPSPEVPKVSTGVYVLNEGLFNQNNSTLTYYDFTTKTPVTDFFTQQNSRGLGDTGNDLKAYGSKLYAVVNASSQLEVLDINTGKSIKQIPMFSANNTPRQPRYIAFHGKYAYVCSFDGTVGRLDTTTLAFDKFITAGRQPNGICVANDKIYVANSGGLDYPNYDNTVSVINTTTFEEIKKITVNSNPNTLQADSEGDVYVISSGNYADIPSAFQRIEATTEAVTTIEGLEASSMSIYEDRLYVYSFDYATKQTSVKVLDTNTETVVTQNFITDGTQIQTPYGIDVDPTNGDVYITDAIDYVTTGTVYCFSQDGKLKYSFDAGLNPNTVVFIQK